MGQRLNISIEKNGTVLANSYYHWSAYTQSALRLTLDLVDYYNQVKHYSSPETRKLKNYDIFTAVRMLETTGAGVNLDEHRRITSDERFRWYPQCGSIKMQFLTANSRNDGLISVTEEGIKETEFWEEGRVTIDIGDETIRFGVMDEYTLEEFRTEFADLIEPGELYADLKECDFDISDAISFDDISKLEDVIDENPHGLIHDGFVYRWIEGGSR